MAVGKEAPALLVVPVGLEDQKMLAGFIVDRCDVVVSERSHLGSRGLAWY